MLKIRPLNHGIHNNMHYLAKDKNGIITFKIVGFFDNDEAYIMKVTSKIDINLLNIERIYNCLLNELDSIGFNLKTPLNDLFKKFENTTEIIVHYNLFNNEP